MTNLPDATALERMIGIVRATTRDSGEAADADNAEAELAAAVLRVLDEAGKLYADARAHVLELETAIDAARKAAP